MISPCMTSIKIKINKKIYRKINKTDVRKSSIIQEAVSGPVNAIIR